MRRPAPRAVLLAALAAACGWAMALQVQEPPTASAQPGAYVTLPFVLTGEGAYDYVVAAPTPWVPLTTAGSVRVAGTGFVSVTMRVPRTALAGESATVALTFTSRTDPAVVTRATGRVAALPLVALDVSAPAEFEGRVDEATSFTVLVRNAGNRADRIRLVARQAMWSSRVVPDEVALAPGEAREVDVHLEPVGQVSPGYRMTVRLEASSELDASVRAAAFTTVTLTSDAMEAGAPGARDDAPPELTLRVRAGLTGALTLEGDQLTARAGYELRPRLAGELSDHVGVTAGVGGLAGTVDDPFHETPSQLDVTLEGATWDAAGSFDQGRYGVSGGATVGAWRVSGGSSLAEQEDGLAFRADALAISQRPDLDLQLSARVSGGGGVRTDAVGVRYGTPLADGVALDLATQVEGTTGPEGYRVEPVVTESLSWQTAAFDVTQSYSGAPLAGLHTLGVSGGTRLLAPLGVRASTSLQWTGGEHRWRNALTVSGSPVDGVGLSLGGALLSSGPYATWTVQPSVAFRFATPSWSTSLGASYAYTGVLRGEATAGSRVQVGSTLRLAELSVRASATAEHRWGPDGEERRLAWEADAGYRIGYGGTLEARVGYRHETDGDTPEGSSDWSLDAAWQQRWTPDVVSRLTYGQAVRRAAASTDRDEHLSLAVSLRDVGVEGIGVSAGYAVSSGTGLLTGIGPLRHELSARVTYTLVLPFATPEPVVDLFGGRLGGLVAGHAYLDRDLDGVRGENEPGIADLELRIGGEWVRTDAEGGYLLRVPAGRQPIGFGSGVPVAVAPRGPGFVDVVDDVDQQLDVRFVPVVTLPVALFDDLDGDGVRAVGESGIAFGGVLIEGPERRAVRLDGRGSATVTGLVPGRYVVRPDAGRLPARYRATTDPVVLTLREGDRPAPIEVGAGAPPRVTVTTFTGSELAVIARVEPAQAPPGGDVKVLALVAGPADRVVVRSVDGGDTELVRAPGGWSAVVRLPRDTPLGSATLRVRAEGRAGQAEASVSLTVVDRALVQADRVYAVVGESFELRLSTAFAAESVVVEVAGDRVALESADGYAWRGTWLVGVAAHEAAGPADEDGAVTLRGRVRVDGEDLGVVTIEVRARGT